MTTTPAAVAIVASPAPRTSGPELRDASTALQPFDRHLDVAKQQADPARHSNDMKSADDSAPGDAAPPKDDPLLIRDPLAQSPVVLPPPLPPAVERDSEPDEQAAAALASAVLALLGPVVPGKPASATAATTAPLGANVGSGPSDHAKSGSMPSTLLQLDSFDTSATTAAGMMALATDTAADGAALLTAAAIVTADLDEARRAPVPVALPVSVPGTIAAAPAHSLQLPAPVGSQAFTQELGQQIAWLGGQDIKQARIRLHPEELGQLDVNVSVLHGRVDVTFHAQHPAAVTALQQSLVQLEQMLAQHGLTLGHAEVGQRDRDPQNARGGTAPPTLAADDLDEVHGAGPQPSSGRINLLDAFA